MKVKLQDVIDGIDMVSEDSTCYLDRETGEVLFISEIADNDYDDDILELLEEGSDRFIEFLLHNGIEMIIRQWWISLSPFLRERSRICLQYR